MSKMSNIHMEISDMISEGRSFEEIARILEVPLHWVTEVAEDTERDFDDSMDGDAASALASCGWGTDEDYGGFDDSF